MDEQTLTESSRSETFAIAGALAMRQDVAAILADIITNPFGRAQANGAYRPERAFAELMLREAAKRVAALPLPRSAGLTRVVEDVVARAIQAHAAEVEGGIILMARQAERLECLMAAQFTAQGFETLAAEQGGDALLQAAEEGAQAVATAIRARGGLPTPTAKTPEAPVNA